MFSTCIFCHASLGANESIEHFPVGKRLAFDAERGRLWAVCPKCTRWNLTPLEERWEALEECERAYRGTRTRVSTDNIALARLRDGTDLVRIGRPMLPELATWRYGSRLRSRRRAFVLSYVGVGAAMFAGGAVVGFAPLVLAGVGSVAGVGGLLGQLGWEAMLKRRRRRPVGWLPAPPGHQHSYGIEHVDSVHISYTPDQLLTLSIDYRAQGPKGSFLDELRKITLVGPEATALLSNVIVHVNRTGASRLDIAEAVRDVEERQHPAELLDRVAHYYPQTAKEYPGLVRAFPPRIRLAMEMTLHADDERRAMAGELGALYARWEEAERVAKIADGALSQLSKGAD